MDGYDESGSAENPEEVMQVPERFRNNPAYHLEELPPVIVEHAQIISAKNPKPQDEGW
jgi:hypothetical protein